MLAKSNALKVLPPPVAAAVVDLRCDFGLCPEAATRRVVTRSPIGRRFERLCVAHAGRRAELEHVLEDEPLDEFDMPIPFALVQRVGGAA